MDRLAADITDQTCKTATQSRTLLGHRRFPRTQLTHSRFTRIVIASEAIQIWFNN